MTYGLTPDGYRPKPFELWLAETKRDVRGDADVDLDLSDDQVLGQIVTNAARTFALLDERLAAVYQAIDPDQAEDEALENIGKFSGTAWRGARPSQVDCVCNLDSGTELVPGEAFAAILGRESQRFTPRAAFTAPTTGNHTIRFVAEFPGPVEAPAGTLTVISPSVEGWNTCTNPEDAVIGTATETNAEFRARRDRELARAAGSTPDGILVDVLDVPGVISSKVYTNRTGVDGVNGLPRNSIEVVVHDFDNADDDAIAQAIFEAFPGGVQWIGEESGEAVSAVTGDTYTINFSRAEVIEVYLAFAFDRFAATYPGDTTAKTVIANYLNELFTVGSEVVALQARAAPIARDDQGSFILPGVRDVTSFGIGVGPDPEGEENLTISQRQIPRFDSSRISIT